MSGYNRLIHYTSIVSHKSVLKHISNCNICIHCMYTIFWVFFIWSNIWMYMYILSYLFMCNVFQALGVFGLCQLHAFVDYIRSRLTHEQFNILFRSIILLIALLGTTAGAIGLATGSILFQLDEQLYIFIWHVCQITQILNYFTPGTFRN